MVSNTNVLNDLDYKKVGTDRWAVRICLNVNPATLSHPCTPTGLIDHQPAARLAVTPYHSTRCAKVYFSTDVGIIYLWVGLYARHPRRF